MASVGKIQRHRGDRWRIRLPGGIDLYCDKQHRSFYSRQHCDWTLAQIQGEMERGVFDPDFYSKSRKSIRSFATYVGEWLKNCERRLERGDLSPTYMREVRRYCHKYFMPVFGPLNMTEIRGQHLKTFYLSLEVAPKTIYNVMSVLRKIFRDAHDEETIFAVPKFPSIGTPPEPKTLWMDEDQQEEIFGLLDPNDLYFILFQATHGTRTGETRALQHQDIDLKNDTVTIQRAFSRTFLRPFTKTKRVRVIPLDIAWKELYQAQPRNLNPEAFVFTRNGQPFSESWARKKWNEARQKTGLASVTLYAGTRHSIASQAANRGVSLYLISRFLGHTNPKQTARYSHVETSGLRKVQRQAVVRKLDPSKRGAE